MDYQPVKGMRDLIGADAVLEEYIEAAFKKVFSSYGYEPLYTPAVENFDLFKAKGGAGEAIKEEIYYFKDKSERELGLRFEFTASTARVVAANQLKLPYRRYQIGEVYRYDKPQAKRYRAFIQADADIFGVAGLEAELELIQALNDYFKALELTPKIIFNSRKLLQSLLGKFALGKELDAMRVLDKLDKVSAGEIKQMLEEKGIDSKVLDVVLRNSFEEIENIVGAADAGAQEVKGFLEMTKKAGLTCVEFDSRLARGLEYYTGIVFEAKIEKGPSIAGGGRYDKLVKLYGGQDTPAVGFAVGISRVFDYLKEKGFKRNFPGLFLFGVGIKSDEILKISSNLRASGINVEVDLVGKGIGKNLDFAQKKGYKFVGIIGENELKENKLTLKNIESGKQEMISIKDAQKLKSLIQA